MSGIVWLASYPKSGNTWLRIFLAHLVSGGDKPVDINALRLWHDDDVFNIASSRACFDELAGLDASELRADEIDCLRPRVYEAYADRIVGAAFVKAHDAYLPAPSGEPLMPLRATRGAIYIVRNPLDVAVSFAFHNVTDFDTAIARMADPDAAQSDRPSRLAPQLRQRLSSWSGHVASWLDAPGLRRHVMRYEEMATRPFVTFSAAARFLDLPTEEERIRQALDGARFDRLREEEARTGFVEKPVRAERFFREGRVGGWRDHLNPAQAARVIADHHAMMRRLGYLDDDGSPIF